MELKQRFAILNDKKKIIKSICPDITNESGIYLFYRKNEDNETCFYVGQAKDLLTRTAQHLMGRTQHIDKSLYVHKLYGEGIPYGWKLKVIYKCGIGYLDFYEQQFIQHYLKQGYKCYNVAGGGQFDKKSDVGERYEVKLKTYKNGKKIAYEKAREYVKEMFDKYLDFTIKGKSGKVKERKFEEFKKWLEVQNEED